MFLRNLAPNFRLYIRKHSKDPIKDAVRSDGKTKNMTTLSIRHSINRPPLRSRLLLTGIVLSFGLLALSPAATGQTCQDGCDTIHNNTFLGDSALRSNTTGLANTAIGYGTLPNNTSGNGNTAVGGGALAANSIGSYNTAIGSGALEFSSTASNNTATGDSALTFNTTGTRNVATGGSALYTNTTGIDNTATGFNALYTNNANYNTADGYKALEKNTTGSSNTATGLNALNKNTIGSANAANGASALYSNTTGVDNTANGFDALYSNVNGYNNTADGYAALFKNSSGITNTAIGSNALYSNTTGGSNIAVGFQAGFNLTTGGNNIDIGNVGVAAEANTIRIGTAGSQINTYVAGISGVTVASGVGVIVDSSGHLGTIVSSARFKEAIKPMDKASEAVFALQPVTFRYKHDLDRDGIPQFGLVAEEVEKVNRDLVARDEQGKPYTVRYEAVNAMLLNEFLKEHQTVQKLKKQVAELTAGLQKVSAELAAASPSSGGLKLSESAPRTVANNR